MKTDPRHTAALQHIQQRLDYQFRQPALLRQALTHRSHSAQNNERFEFVGDAILNYCIAKMLFEAFPKLSEGQLSRLRANLVNQDILADVAGELGVGEGLYLCPGELKSGGFRRPSILADAVEALLAAISFDADLARAEATVRRLFAQRIRQVDLGESGKDAKSRLQETLQAQRLPLPKYRILAQTGEAHEQEFLVECDLGELGHQSQARGGSRREAEQKAAAAALAWWQQHAKPRRGRQSG